MNGHFFTDMVILKKLLMPGKTFRSVLLNGYSVEVYNVSEPFSPQRELNLYLGDEKLKEALTIVDVKDNEIALYFEEERLVNFLKTRKVCLLEVVCTPKTGMTKYTGF